MADLGADTKLPWVAGFEGDRRIVVSRLGFMTRVFARPHAFKRRFYQSIIDVPIENWEIQLDPPSLGALCTLKATLEIRFQPTLAFAQGHVEQIDRLGDYIRTHYHSLIKDAAEEELLGLQQASWLDLGHSLMERGVEDLVHELLAMRDIQSRCHCRIDAIFQNVDLDQLDADLASADPGRNAIALEILKRRRETLERMSRERHDQALLEQRLRLEQEEEMLELLKRETAIVREQQREAVLRAREILMADETREAEKIDSEVRLKRERIRHDAELKRLEIEANLQEKSQRASSYSDVHGHLQREIELLALERQRLALEEEINKTKLERAKGWVIGAKQRFALGKKNEETLGESRQQDSG